MRTREIKSLEKIWASFVSWNQSEDDGSQNQAAVAKEKAKAKCKKSCDCEHFGEWQKQNISCKSCTGIVSEICQYLTKEDLARKEAEEKAKREEKATKTKNDDMENAIKFILENPVLSRKAIVTRMSENSSRSEGGWKTMIGAICLAIKHIESPGSGAYGIAAQGIQENVNTFSELKKYVAQKEQKTEGAVGRSVQYVWATWNAMRKMEI